MASLQKAGLAGATALCVTVFLTPAVRSFAVRVGLVARPMGDRWGKRVVARLGGVAMFIGFLAAAVAWVPKDQTLAGLLVGVVLVFLLGLLDDVRPIRPYTKLLGQLCVGCAVVMGGIQIELIQWPWLSIPLSVLWFVLLMNAFNLLDNMDGLAAGIGALAAAFCALHAAMAQEWIVVTLGLLLCGVCGGFLLYNFPPAKIYMGDSGSQLLGLCLAAFVILGSWRHSTSLVSVLAVPVLVLGVPIFDTLFVTIQRLLHRQHPFVGGRDHVSHRLAILGLSTRQTIVALYGISACLGLLSLATAQLNLLPALATWVSVVTGLMLFGRYLGRVKVYQLEEPTAPGPDPWALRTASGPPTTLIETMLLHKRRLVEIVVDFALISSVYVFAYLLRFEGSLPSYVQSLVVQSLPMILMIKIACLGGCGVYRGIWRYLGLSDTINILKAVTLGSILSAVALLYVWRFTGYSRAVFIIDWMLTFMAVAGARVIERMLAEWINATAGTGAPALILGAGDTGEMVLRYLKYESKPTRRVVGFLDDDVRKHGNRIHGTPVLGGRARLAEVLQAYRVREVLVAINDPPGELLQHVQRCCEPRGVTWKVVTAGITAL